MQKTFLTVCLTLFVACGMAISGGGMPAHAEEAKADQNTQVQFQWAFGALKKANGSKFEVITKDTHLKTGDQIKFFLKVSENCFVYLIYRKSSSRQSC